MTEAALSAIDGKYRVICRVDVLRGQISSATNGCPINDFQGIWMRSILANLNRNLNPSHFLKYYLQYEASKTNSMVEATLAGSWLCVIFWLGGFILIVVQKYVIRQQKIEQELYSELEYKWFWDEVLLKFSTKLEI